MNKTVFVSRNIAAESCLHTVAASRDYTLVACSLLEIRYLRDFHLPDQGDWYFFYSAEGVRAWSARVLSTAFDPAGSQYAAIGPGTAEALRAAGLPVDFCGTGDPHAAAYAFLQVAAGAVVIFVQAMHSQNSVHHILGDKVRGTDLVVYENREAPRLLPDCAVYLFTSPMNTDAFFRLNSIPGSSPVIAIGRSTKASLEGYDIRDILMPESPSEKGLCDLLRLIL